MVNVGFGIWGLGFGISEMFILDSLMIAGIRWALETTITAAKPQINNFLQTIHEQMAVTKGEPVQCSFCSATLADFRATGRLGCAHCYETFESSLRDLLRRVHGNSRHIGRRYVAPLPSELPHVSTATELRDRLKRAIEAEQFELAADIRDKLRGIE